MYFGNVFKQRKKLEELYLSIWKYSTTGCDATHHSVINHPWHLNSNTKYWLNSVYSKWGEFQFVSCATVIPDKKVIISDKAPDTIGSSSQAVDAGNTLYISAQLGLEPEMGQLAPGRKLAKTQQALRNVDALLREPDYTQRDVV
jgi:hypothetical protein